VAGPYALIQGGRWPPDAVGPIPDYLANSTVAQQEAAGWFLIDVTTNPRPADTATTTWSSGFVPVVRGDGKTIAREEWTSVPKTAKQMEEETRVVKANDLRSQAQAAYGRLDQIADYVPPPITSNAIAQTELAKTMTAVQDMAIYMKRIIRLVMGGAMLDPDKD
jgi:hypothetical protein